jgi:hypothetical protein
MVSSIPTGQTRMYLDRSSLSSRRRCACRPVPRRRARVYPTSGQATTARRRRPRELREKPSGVVSTARLKRKRRERGPRPSARLPWNPRFASPKEHPTDPTTQVRGHRPRASRLLGDGHTSETTGYGNLSLSLRFNLTLSEGRSPWCPYGDMGGQPSAISAPLGRPEPCRLNFDRSTHDRGSAPTAGYSPALAGTGTIASQTLPKLSSHPTVKTPIIDIDYQE